MNTLVLDLTFQTHRGASAWAGGELEAAILRTVAGCVVAFAVFRLVPKMPWPRPFRWRFLGFHMIAAPVAATIWFLASFPVEARFGWGASSLDASKRFGDMVLIGSIFYLLVAGLAYSADGAARAARAEAITAQTQLAALRSQLQPHFLFNALHTIVQLIHIDPRRATDAAEMVADLLRRTLEEQREEVSLRDEWSFVSRYLAVEQIRFGERLVVTADLPPELQADCVPCFALQTLVENAVQHGAAHRVAPTEIAITVTRSDSKLVISVRNDGDRDGLNAANPNTGTGLARLRERLSVLYGDAATLISRPLDRGGYEAALTIPQDSGRRA